jgi:hypothetical protein
MWRERWERERRLVGRMVTRRAPSRGSGWGSSERNEIRDKHAPAIWSTGCNPTSPWYSFMVAPVERSISPMMETNSSRGTCVDCGAVPLEVTEDSDDSCFWRGGLVFELKKMGSVDGGTSP